MTTAEATFPIDVTRADAAIAITRRYAYWSAAAGVVPMPMVDLLLIGGVQVKMVNQLAKLYEQPHSETLAKSLIGAVVGTVVPFGAASMVVGGVSSALKAVPVVGSLATLTLGPALGFASTYAVGRVFSRHFATGGSLMNFSPDKARDEYRTEFEAARKTAGSDAEVVAEAKKQPK